MDNGKEIKHESSVPVTVTHALDFLDAAVQQDVMQMVCRIV